MFDLTVYLTSLAVLCGMGLTLWPVSIWRKNAGIVDSLWSLFFVAAAVTAFLSVEEPSGRAWMVVGLVTIWGVRLAVHIGWRNHGKAEDHRYQAIRRNNEPFWIKSLYIVFLLQAGLAWLVSLPLHAAVLGPRPLHYFDWAGLIFFSMGLFFEAVGDFQLARFKADPSNKGKVLQTGLWRYTRHPNYFGDFCVWWGFYLMACAAGGWWSFPAPLLMTFLLLRVSGVRLLEKDIGQRRPDYAAYIQRTNAFFPWFPKD
jgi:steroid 5-alpha reductase family enzyme